jgi:dTDP-4-dehydrorhamnose reductase
LNKVLITGASGFVGSGIIRYFTSSQFEIIPTDIVAENSSSGTINIDITDFTTTRKYIQMIKPDIIIHLAGCKDVFKCESQKEYSRKINFEATKNLAKISADVDCKLIFISSDYVFGGPGVPFNELSEPCPTTQYGKDKLAAENYICNYLRNYALVRTSGIFGMNGDYVTMVLYKIKNNQVFEAFTNLKNNPTFIVHLCDMLKIIIQNDLIGIFHCTGQESISRYQFALKVASVFECEKKNILPALLDLSNDPRPEDLSMDSVKTYNSLNYFPDTISVILQANKNLW